MCACVRVSLYVFGGPAKSILRCSLIIFKYKNSIRKNIETRMNYLIESLPRFQKIYISIIEEKATKERLIKIQTYRHTKVKKLYIHLIIKDIFDRKLI